MQFRMTRTIQGPLVFHILACIFLPPYSCPHILAPIFLPVFSCLYSLRRLLILHGLKRRELKITPRFNRDRY